MTTTTAMAQEDHDASTDSGGGGDESTPTIAATTTAPVQENGATATPAATTNGAAKPTSSTAVPAPDVTKITYRSSSEGYHYYLRVVDDAWFAQDDLGYWYYQSATEGFLPCDVEEVVDGELKVEYDEAGHAIFPRNAIGHFTLPVDSKGAKKFPLDFVGRPLFPYDDKLKSYVFPRSDDGQPLFPLNRKGKPVVPLDDDDKPIFPTGTDGKLIFPVRDGKPVPAYTQNEKCVLPLDANGKVVVPYDEQGKPLIELEKDGVTPIDMDEEYVRKQWEEYQKAQAAQYQQALYAQQVAAHYNTPQRGYAGFDSSIPPPSDMPAVDAPLPAPSAEEEEKKRKAKLLLDASLALMRNKTAGPDYTSMPPPAEPKRSTNAAPPSLLSGKQLSVADTLKKASKPSISSLHAMRREIHAEIAEERHQAWERRQKRGSMSPDRTVRRGDGKTPPPGPRHAERSPDRRAGRSPDRRRSPPRRDVRGNDDRSGRRDSRPRRQGGDRSSQRPSRDDRRRSSKSPPRRHRSGNDEKSSRRDSERTSRRDRSPRRDVDGTPKQGDDRVVSPIRTGEQVSLSPRVSMKDERLIVQVKNEPTVEPTADVVGDEKKHKAKKEKKEKKKHKKDKKHKDSKMDRNVKIEPESPVKKPAVVLTGSIPVLDRNDQTVEVQVASLYTTRAIPLLQWSVKPDMAQSYKHIHNIFEEVGGPRKAAAAFRELEIINREKERLRAIEQAKEDELKAQEEAARLEREKLEQSQAMKWRKVEEREEGEDITDDDEVPLDALRQEAISSLLHKSHDSPPVDVKQERDDSPSSSSHKKSKKKSKKSHKRKHSEEDVKPATSANPPDLADLIKKSGIPPEKLLGLFQTMITSSSSTAATTSTEDEPKEKRAKESKSKKHKK